MNTFGNLVEAGTKEANIKHDVGIIAKNLCKALGMRKFIRMEDCDGNREGEDSMTLAYCPETNSKQMAFTIYINEEGNIEMVIDIAAAIFAKSEAVANHSMFDLFSYDAGPDDGDLNKTKTNLYNLESYRVKWRDQVKDIANFLQNYCVWKDGVVVDIDIESMVNKEKYESFMKESAVSALMEVA